MEDAFQAGPRPARGLGWSLLALTAVLAAGCSNYVGTTAASYLRRVREEPDPNLRYVAYTKLSQPNCYDSVEQKAEAVKTLIAKLEQGKEPLATRAVIVHTLGSIGDPAARDTVVKLVNDPEAVLRVQACRALGKVGRPEDGTVLARVMTVDALEDCRIAAIDALGDLKPNDPRINQMLIAGMRHEDPATRLASLKSLRKITGKDHGVDALAWQVILPKEGDTQVATASASASASASREPADPPGAAKAAYPPRPGPLQSIVDSKTEMEGKPSSNILKRDASSQALEFPEDPPGATAPPGVGIGSYPATNPNLPAPPR